MGTRSRLLAALFLGVFGSIVALPTRTVQVHAAPHVAGLVQVGGFLDALPSSSAAPATLVLSTARGPVTVQVSTGTSLLRREGVSASLAQFMVNDQLHVVGLRLGPMMIQATQIQDLSIEGVVGLRALITMVTPSSLGVTRLSDAVGVPGRTLRRAPLPPSLPFIPPVGQSFILPVSASTAVTTAGGTAYGSTLGLTLNTVISFSAIFNLQSRSFTLTTNVSVLNFQPPTVSVRAQGYLLSAPAGVTPPISLSVLTPQGPVTVNVSSSTTLVRRFGGQSGLDELSAGDQLLVTGTVAGPGAINATRIQDLSIQAAYTTLVGAILQVTPSSVQVMVQQDETHRSPFRPGQIFALPVGPGTKVTVGTGTTLGSTAGLLPGQQITALGVYNRTGSQFQSTFSIRVRSVSRTYTGFLIAAPTSTTAPANLVLQLHDGHQVQVQVLPTTAIVRRYNGKSGLDELSAGDQLVVTGQQSGTQPLVATRIQDNSIQVAYTAVVGIVTGMNPSTGTLTLLVQHDVYNRSPLTPGQSVLLVIGPATLITSGSTVTIGNIGAVPFGATVTALGVYDRASNTFVSTARIRIH